jgi:serine protease
MQTVKICAIAGAVIVSLAVIGAQGDRGPAFPIIVSEAAPAGIDRGLRDVDPPRDPRGIGAQRSAEIVGAELARPVTMPGEPYVRGSIIVKFRPGTGAEARRAMLGQVNGSTTRALSYTDFDIVAIDPDADPEAAARRLDAQPDVEYAQARYLVHPMFVPNDPLYSRQWSFPTLDMERAWDINPGATSSVVVAVLDSGIAYRSAVARYNARAFRVTQNGPVFPALGQIDVSFAAAPDLVGPDRFVLPRDFIWDTTTPLDLDGHGTHVSGTIGQLTNNSVGVAGMAFNVRIMPVKVVGGDWDLIFGSPFQGTDDVVARGVRYAADNGAKVLNMSIGRSGPPAPVVQEAIAYAVRQGAFVSVAAGNEFEQGNPVERLAEFAPQIDGMVSVGAIGRDKNRAFYSSTGSYVELVAPGGNSRQGGRDGAILQQTFDLSLVETFLGTPAQYRAPRFDAFTYEFFQGTSMAAPHVSGFAALLIQQGITTPAAIEAVMKRYATDLGPAGRDNEYGSGLINPRSSLRGLGLVK